MAESGWFRSCAPSLLMSASARATRRRSQQRSERKSHASRNSVRKMIAVGAYRFSRCRRVQIPQQDITKTIRGIYHTVAVGIFSCSKASDGFCGKASQIRVLHTLLVCSTVRSKPLTPSRGADMTSLLWNRWKFTRNVDCEPNEALCGTFSPRARSGSSSSLCR